MQVMSILFLKYGNTDKLSVETVRKVLAFINEY